MLKKQTNKKKEIPNKTQHGTSRMIAHSCSLSLYIQQLGNRNNPICFSTQSVELKDYVS